MKPADLTRRLRRLATRNGWEIEISEGGSHTKVRLNGKRTVIGRHPGDLKNDTYRGILKQLGLIRSEVED